MIFPQEDNIGIESVLVRTMSTELPTIFIGDIADLYGFRRGNFSADFFSRRGEESG